MKNITQEEQANLLIILEKRFNNNMNRHPQLNWKKDILNRLENNSKKINSLFLMEKTSGEPDVIGQDSVTKEIIFVDCSSESPKERRSICYDHQALESRKQFKPHDSAVNMAKEMGIEILNEQQYFELQSLGEFDLKTSSWIKTPENVRKKGGALFGDRRFGRVFIYHNGAESYYAARGFRGILKV